MGHRREFYEVWEQRVLGDQSFAEEALVPRREVVDLTIRTTVEEILGAVAEQVGMSVSSISTASRARGPAHARAVVAYLARELAHLPLTVVARAVRRDPVTLSHAVRRLELALERTPQVRRQVDRIAQLLRGNAKKQKIKRTA
jgi:chromosomal replication initiation ATPase DnaA